jgi:hypothetical protein
MSLEINVDKVVAVLLPSGWEGVQPDTDGVSTLVIDAVHFAWDEPGGKLTANAWSPGPGFEFRSARDGRTIAGPLSSLLAVRHGR